MPAPSSATAANSSVNRSAEVNTDPKSEIVIRPANPTFEEGLAYAKFLDQAADGFIRFMLVPTESPYRFSLALATILTTGYVGLSLVIHAVGHFFVYPHDPTGNYYAVRQAGWHPFWDRLWPIFNPDSDLIREGGFEEPEYTDFVPPADWQYQCPAC